MSVHGRGKEGSKRFVNKKNRMSSSMWSGLNKKGPSTCACVWGVGGGGVLLASDVIKNIIIMYRYGTVLLLQPLWHDAQLMRGTKFSRGQCFFYEGSSSAEGSVFFSTFWSIQLAAG